MLKHPLVGLFAHERIGKSAECISCTGHLSFGDLDAVLGLAPTLFCIRGKTRSIRERLTSLL